MELQKDLKERLLAGEIIELSSEHDLVQLFYRKSLSRYDNFFIELNGIVVSMNRQFYPFKNKVLRVIDERSLTLTESD